MDLTLLSAILVGAGCLALGYYIGARYPARIFISARLPEDIAVDGNGKKNDKPKVALEIEKLADILEDFKMVLVVRNDLKMGKGKISAQCSHATLGLYKKLLRRAPKALNRWEMCAQPKVVVKIESEEDMLVLQERAKSLNIPTHITIDAGRTQIAPRRRRRMWGGVYLEVMLLLLGLLVMAQVQESVQLRCSHPTHGVVERINENAGPYIGLVMTFPTEELVLQTSGFFVPSSYIPWVDLAGRRFNIGKINGTDVIYVMTGEQTLNAGIAVQTLIDTFDIQGIVHYGIAGSTNDSLNIGDVSVPNYVAFTGSWKWKEFKSAEGGLTELKFGAFNFPEKGENLLAKIDFTPQQLFSAAKPMEEVFWLPIEPNFFNIATTLQDLKLLQCLNETFCLPETPKVVYGLRGSTADIYLDNAAYRKFLFKEFNVSTADEESAAIVMTSLSNGVPCIVFRGVSDLAGGEEKLSATSLSSLAAMNALIVAVEFIGLSSKEAVILDH
ncbi:hypothetical protein FH972_016039 [Carpinus fangiana]|uniref:peptidyl-tRNA hydrolase n=1 Tax=Carpinus fangiana TaxID=176857 RepID=A0A5N6RF72_9ROSI|nr:hypothetical protein FH972_016039 [Carpinus fangiana]